MSAVFVSYRRDGALVHARAVFERLSREFGVGQVFIDLESIDVGVDFVDLIETQLQGCQVMLALIDPDWVTAVDRQGRRRITLANSYVRIEIATALKRGIRVMPILLDAADMPDEDALPDDLKPLVRRHALSLDFRRFDAEAGRLAGAIRRVLDGPAKPTVPPAASPAAPATAPAPAASKNQRAPGTVFNDGPGCPDMVVIPAGSFMMGSPEGEPGRFPGEGPQQRVTLATFALGRTPVTQGQWRALMGGNPSDFKQGGDDFPVESVSWDDAQPFLRALSAKTGKDYHLPSEAQWEYAARAGTITPYYTGETITLDQACFEAESPVRVGSFAANPFGLQDMLGNVGEWVQDCYYAKAYTGAAPSDGSAFEKTGCASRVLRGGSWCSDSRALRAAYRNGFAPVSCFSDVGFRVCRISPSNS